MVFRHDQPRAWAFHQHSTNGPHLTAPFEPTATRTAPPLRKRYPGAVRIALPDAEPPPRPLGELLRERASCRRFDGSPITVPALATLLRYTYGILEVETDGVAPQQRPVPSGGACYPLELYVLLRQADSQELAPGIYHYAAEAHVLEQVRGPVPWPSVVELFLGQPYLGPASAIVVLTAAMTRTTARYGERGYRLVLLEAGHTAQNLNLLATALDLGSLDLAGFQDLGLAELLALDPETEVPLYGIALGVPATRDPRQMREFQENDRSPR